MATKTIRVRAKEVGYYKERRWRVGSVLDIPDDEHVIKVKNDKGELVDRVISSFSPNWMEKVSANTPLKSVRMPKDILPPGFKQPTPRSMREEDDVEESVL